MIGLALASEPRLDLYRQIKKETGVSLKEAHQAVLQGDQNSALSLQAYAKKMGIKEIDTSLDEDIAHRVKYCKEKKGIACRESVQELKSQQTLFRELHSNYEKLDGHRKLYYCLVVYNFYIKEKVLKSAFMDWDKNCSSQEKINTRSCQDKLFESHVLADISNDLTQIALAKSEKEAPNSTLIKSVKERISRYESL